MKLDTANLDRLIQETFPGPDDEDIYQNGLCRAFAIGLDAFLRKRDPVIATTLLIADHEETFDHVALQVHGLDNSFDSRGSGAQERWADHRGGMVDWRESQDLRCRIAGGRLSSVFQTDWRKEARKVEESLETVFRARSGAGSSLPKIPHVPQVSLAENSVENMSRRQR
jgi:hypothetical protein